LDFDTQRVPTAIRDFRSLSELLSHYNLKSRLAFLDKIFSLTSTDNA
jgi:hypothetical protein